jgi:hypothetical protein
MVLCSLTGGRGRQSGVHHAGSMMGNDPITPATVILKKWPDALKKDDAAPSKNDSGTKENNDVQSSQTKRTLLQSAASPEELDELLHGRVIPREPFRDISQEEEEEVSSSDEEEQYKQIEEDEYEDDEVATGNIPSVTEETTDNDSIDIYDISSEMEALKKRQNTKKESNSILNEYGLCPLMICLVFILRVIVIEDPTSSPIQIILIVLMHDYLEYDMDSNDVEGHQSVINRFRERWAKVGKNINMGQPPDGNALGHFFLAFGTLATMLFTDGGDAVDKMDPLNHTLSFMYRNILQDYLHYLGYKCTQEEADRIGNRFFTRSDAFPECGPNKAAPYHKQIIARFKAFCHKFKDRLLIPGTSIIESVEYTHFNGIHISALVGSLDLCFRAQLTKLTTNETLRVLVHSSRVLGMVFKVEEGKHLYDVRFCKRITICPAPHPNSAQKWITTFPLKIIRKIDISYSHACLLLAERLGLSGNKSRSWNARYMLVKNKNNETSNEAKKKIEMIDETNQRTRDTNQRTREVKKRTREINKQINQSVRLQKRAKKFMQAKAARQGK